MENARAALTCLLLPYFKAMNEKGNDVRALGPLKIVSLAQG